MLLGARLAPSAKQLTWGGRTAPESAGSGLSALPLPIDLGREVALLALSQNLEGCLHHGQSKCQAIALVLHVLGFAYLKLCHRTLQ